MNSERLLTVVYLLMFIAFFVAAGTLDRAEDERTSLQGYLNERICK